MDQPGTAAALAEGRISYSKVRAIMRFATVDTESFFLNVAEHGTAAHLERIVGYARCGLTLDDPDRLRALLTKSFCDWYYDDDGMLVLRARLMPDDGARLVAALEAIRARENGGQLVPSRDPQQCHQPAALPMSAQRAYALALVAVEAGEDAAANAAPIARKVAVPQIVVHIHADVGAAHSKAKDVCAERSATENDSAESLAPAQ